MNKVTLLGRIGMDPQVRGTVDRPVASFSLATNVRYRKTNPGEPEPKEDEFMVRTDWHNIVVFRTGLAKTVLDHMQKGNY